MNKKFLTDIKKIKDAINSKKLVVFAGAGISIDAGVPSWSNLINEIRQEIDVPNSESDYLRIAQMYFNERHQKEYIEKVRSVLKHKKIKYNEIHQAVLDLQPEHIITTNFDDLLEQVIKANSSPFSIIKTDKDFPYALNTNLLVKMHGDLDGTDIVLKEDDYLNYQWTHPLTEGFIKSIFATKVVLFVGYSFSDVNLKLIVQSVRNILGNDFQSAYLITTDVDVHYSQREYLKSKGINIIAYNDACSNSKEDLVEKYLRGENTLKINYLKNWRKNKLSEQGQKLLLLLSFIKEYNHFNESLAHYNIIDQMMFSLERFSELKSLPPKFISGLYPFNIPKEYSRKYDELTLLTNNHVLYDFFKKQVSIEGNGIKFTPLPGIEITAHEVKSVKENLEAVLKTLNYSMIFYLKFNQRGYGVSNDEREETIDLYVENDSNKCDCFNCLWNDLKLSEFIVRIGNSQITENSNISEDLILAYANYKAGNFSQSYFLFSELAGKAWDAGKYITYYIVKQNIKNLRNLLIFHDSQLDEQNRKWIIFELDKLDLDKLLYQISNLGDHEYELLKTIRDDDVLDQSEKRVDELLIKAVETFDQYKRGGEILIGPYYPQDIIAEVEKVKFFYTYNYIVADEFDNYIIFCNKAIEALTILHAIDKKYRLRYESLQKLYFETFIFYGKIERLEKVFERYQLKSLQFKKEDIDEIMEMVTNLFISSYSKSIFNEVQTNEQLKGQFNNFFFKKKIIDIVTRIIFLLSKTKINYSNSWQFVTEFKNFLSSEAVLYWKSIRNLGNLIYINRHLFQLSDLIYLLELPLKNDKLFKDIYVESVALSINKEFPDYILDDTKQAKSLIESINEKGEKKALIALWLILAPEEKELIKRIVVQALEEKFDEALYWEASINKLIDYKQFFDSYLSFIEDLIQRDMSKPAKKAKINEEKSFFIKDRNVHHYIDFVYFVNSLNVDKELGRVKELRKKSQLIHFYLSPSDFNMSNLDTSWLKIRVDKGMYKEILNSEEVKRAIVSSLLQKYDETISKIYFKFFA